MLPHLWIMPNHPPKYLCKCSLQSAVYGVSWAPLPHPHLYSAGSSVFRFFSLAFCLHYHQNALVKHLLACGGHSQHEYPPEPCSLGTRSGPNTAKASAHSDKPGILWFPMDHFHNHHNSMRKNLYHEPHLQLRKLAMCCGLCPTQFIC